eukprot:10608593-Prorocentrum_lima.AAC.1
MAAKLGRVLRCGACSSILGVSAVLCSCFCLLWFIVASAGCCGRSVMVVVVAVVAVAMLLCWFKYSKSLVFVCVCVQCMLSFVR